MKLRKEQKEKEERARMQKIWQQEAQKIIQGEFCLWYASEFLMIHSAVIGGGPKELTQAERDELENQRLERVRLEREALLSGGGARELSQVQTILR